MYVINGILYCIWKYPWKCSIIDAVFGHLQREEAVVFPPGTCGHGEWRFILHAEREVKPSGRVGAKSFGRVPKDQRIWRLSARLRAYTSVPENMSLSSLLWVRDPFIKKKKWWHLRELTTLGTVQTGVLFLMGRLTNLPMESYRGSNAKLSQSVSRWREFMWWTSRTKWVLFVCLLREIHTALSIFHP